MWRYQNMVCKFSKPTPLRFVRNVCLVACILSLQTNVGKDGSGYDLNNGMSCLALNVYILGNNALPTHQHGLQEVSTHVIINAYKGTKGKVQLHIPILPFNPKVCFMLRAWEIQLSMQAWNAKLSTII